MRKFYADDSSLAHLDAESHHAPPIIGVTPAVEVVPDLYEGTP